MQQALRETLEQCMLSEQLPQLSNLPQVCLLEHTVCSHHTAEGSHISVAACVCLCYKVGWRITTLKPNRLLENKAILAGTPGELVHLHI